jgi:hypothetical protein
MVTVHMDAGSHPGIARLVQQCLCTNALFPSYVFVTIIMRMYYYYYYIISLQTHKKSIRIQQHPTSAFTAPIKNSTG